MKELLLHIFASRYSVNELLTWLKLEIECTSGVMVDMVHISVYIRNQVVMKWEVEKTITEMHRFTINKTLDKLTSSEKEK